MSNLLPSEREWRNDVIRIVCISDTHGKQGVFIPDGDVVIHAGDFSSVGALQELRGFKSMIDSLPHAQKLVVAGNHDISLHTEFFASSGSNFQRKLFNRKGFDPIAHSLECRSMITSSSWPMYSYLEDSSCELVNPVDYTPTDITVYGSPWQPEFCDWAYNLPKGPLLKEKWDMIPDNTDVLITHGPPFGVLDLAAYDNISCGCDNLLDAVTNRVKPRLHIFGHIHEGYGTYFNGTTLFVNASTCTLNYQPTNPPVVIDLPIDKSQLPIVVSGGTSRRRKGRKMFENLVCNISIQENLNLTKSQVEIVPNNPLSIVVSSKDYHNYSVVVDVTECLGFPQVYQLFAHPSNILLKPSFGNEDIVKDEGVLLHTHMWIFPKPTSQYHDKEESSPDTTLVEDDTFDTISLFIVPRGDVQDTLSIETTVTLMCNYFINEFCWLTILLVSCIVVKIVVS